jgi:hypothetical protein
LICAIYRSWVWIEALDHPLEAVTGRRSISVDR